MWIFTTSGFFSVVQKPGTDFLTVRARAMGDLDRLREQYLPTLTETVAGAGTDYPYRATISHGDLAGGMAQILSDLTYSNFKNAVADVQGYERARTYGRVWSDLLDLEHQEGRP